MCIMKILRAFWAHSLAFQRALLNFQRLRAQGPFLFETLPLKIQTHDTNNFENIAGNDLV